MSDASKQSRFYCAHPCFIVNDLVASAEFYRDKLGFRFHRYWGEPPCFVMVARDNVEFFLSYQGPKLAKPNHLTNAEVPWDAYVRVADADALCAEFKSRGVKIHREPETAFYDQREFEIEDPDGYRICFAHSVTAPNSNPA
ncbi:MAG TPA: VOC family protein [Candidatus Acidoferrales bacterium]|nr:VOC family protein [Candidatus Acidoferrales bacterium]